MAYDKFAAVDSSTLLFPPTVRANLAAVSPNYVINGGFDFWQRGTSFTWSSGSPYTADRWGLTQAGTAHAKLNQSTSVPTGFKYSAKVSRTSGSTQTGTYYLGHSLEIAESIKLAGKTVTLSFYAKAGANYSATGSLLGLEIHSGTGTSEVNRLNVAYTGDVTLLNSPSTLTTSWQRFSKTVTVASDVTQLGFYFASTPVGTAGADDAFYITGVQLEEGSVATTFRRNGTSMQGELAACQRYFEKTYALATAPGTATYQGFKTFGGVSNASGAFIADFKFAVAKRAAATCTGYSPSSGASGSSDYSRNGASGVISAYFDNIGEFGGRAYIASTGAGWAASIYEAHWTADAEL